MSFHAVLAIELIKSGEILLRSAALMPPNIIKCSIYKTILDIELSEYLL